MFCEPGLLDILIPSRVLVSQDFQRRLARNIQVKEIILDLMISNKFLLELSHINWTAVLEPGHELTVRSVGEIDSVLVKFRLCEVSSIHYR